MTAQNPICRSDLPVSIVRRFPSANVSWKYYVETPKRSPSCTNPRHVPGPTPPQLRLWKLVSALTKSQYWSSSVVFLTWDDYGGFYENVAPLEVDAHGYGPGLRLLVISAYARPDYITNQLGSFGSILRFIEERFNLRHLTARDERASDMSDAFDFNQKSNPPFTISVFTGLISYCRKYDRTFQPTVPISAHPIRGFWGPGRARDPRRKLAPGQTGQAGHGERDDQKLNRGGE